VKVRGFHQGQGYQSVTPAEGRIYVSNRFSASRKPCAEAGSIYALTNASSSRSTDARSKIEQSRIEYNRERPHPSLAHLMPEEFAARNQMSSAIARTDWPAEKELAGAVRCAPASDSKPDRFSTALRS
jgi:hypothetical protein